MVKVHKRKKNSRIRGSRTAGWGFRQKHKGHGNKGGVGMAGTGKRADHKKQKAVSMDKKKKYFGKQGLTSRKAKKSTGPKMNLSSIKENLFKKDGDKIDLKKYTLLGVGEGFKAEITAKRASKAAIEKMTKAGGKIILPEVKQKVKTTKEETKVEKPKKEESKEKAKSKK